MKKLLALAVVILGFTAVSFGQVSDIATASATIVGPIAITKTADLNFGNLAVNTNAGTAVITADAAQTVSTTGGVTKVAGVPPTNAQFTVTGVAGYGFTISVPASVVLNSGANNMTLTLASTPSSPSILTGGTATIYVGGSLAVGASQPSGTYKNTTDLKVTVNYN